MKGQSSTKPPPRTSLPALIATPETVAQPLLIALGLSVIGVLAIRFAEPILDGDLFWHLKYAEQMIERATLVPDHTLYSWTPATNDTIYCAWISELLLYTFHSLGGLPVLFAFRYLCVAIAAALLWRYAWSRGMPRLQTLAIVFLSLLAAIGGTIIKPEILSFVAFHLVLFAYCMGRAADRNNADPRIYFLLVPLIVLLWANAHGGFVLAAPFFASVFCGEILMRRFAPSRALSKRGFHSLLIAWALSALAVCLTPYGWRYPVQLVADYVLRTGPRVGESWNTAYQSVLSSTGFSELLAYGALLAVTLTGLALMARRRLANADWALLIALVVYTPLFLLYARATFYLAIVFGYLALDILAAAKASLREAAIHYVGGTQAKRWNTRHLVSGVAAISIIAAGSVALHAARLANKGSWIGFGIGYVNPVVEAEFLAAARLGPRLYNIFDAGGYLLWRLEPGYKVMIDPRFFPYQEWFDDLYHFSIGERFAEFLRKYPADTAVIDLDRVGVWKNFLQSPEWKLVFYGPTSAVLVRGNVSRDRVSTEFAADRFDRLRNADVAVNVFDFATVIGDYATAWTALAQVETRLRYMIDSESLRRMTALRDGYRLLAASDYDRALAMFRAAAKRSVQGWREPVIVKLLEDRAAAMVQNDAAAVTRHDAALRELAVVL